MKKLSKAQEFLLSLETERFNVAHRRAEPKAQFVFVPEKCRRKHQSDNRDKLFFHAGRFAAGARDTVAIKANDAMQKEMNK